MYKVIILIFAALVLLSFSSKKEPPYGFKGKVKFYSYCDYHIKWSSQQAPQSILSSKLHYQYNSKENLTSGDNCQNDMCSNFIRQYNDKGLLAEYTIYNSQGKGTSHTYKYDTKGKMLEHNTMTPSGVTYKSVFLYDNKGNMVEEDNYLGNGTIRKSIIHRYDKKSQLIWENFDSGDKNAHGYRYDKKNNKIEMDVFKSDTILIEKHIYLYDKKGRKIDDDTYKPDGSLVVKYTYLYDDKGSIILQTEYSPDGSIDKTINKFTYDKIGNWTIDSTFTNDTLTYIRTQEFVYY
jgi:YD repeat-containing protein